MTTRIDTFTPSLPTLRLVRDAAAKLASAVVLIHEAFAEGQQQMRDAEKRYGMIAE